MDNNSKKRLYPKNPLGIIALFVFLIEGISTASLKFVLENQSQYVGHIVWFIILFPSLIALLFFGTLWWRRESFYSPEDFREDSSFISLIQKVERLEIRQEASQLDPTADIDAFLKTLETLVKRDDIYAAVQVGRSALKESQYESSSQIFQYLLQHVSSSHELHTRMLANLAYSLIGLGKFSEAIRHLLEVRKIREEKRFYPWHAIALAYSYFQLGELENYKEWVEYAKKREEYAKSIPAMAKLYPEIKKDLLGQ